MRHTNRKFTALVPLTAAVLAACGTASSSPANTQHAKSPAAAASGEYGWVGGKPNSTLTNLRLPYIGTAPLPIAQIAAVNKAYYREVTNPQDWVTDPQLFLKGAHVFVGQTTGVQRQYVLQSKYSFLKYLALLQGKISGVQWSQLPVLAAVLDIRFNTNPAIIAGPQLAKSYNSAVVAYAKENGVDGRRFTLAAPGAVDVLAAPPTGVSSLGAASKKQHLPRIVEGFCVPSETQLFYGSVPQIPPSELASGAPFTAGTVVIPATSGVDNWPITRGVANCDGLTVASLLKLKG